MRNQPIYLVNDVQTKDLPAVAAFTSLEVAKEFELVYMQTRHPGRAVCFTSKFACCLYPFYNT